jgi:hypothetical protein
MCVPQLKTHPGLLGTAAAAFTVKNPLTATAQEDELARIDGHGEELSTQLPLNRTMAHQKSSKSRSCFSTGDCESSFTMRVKCGKFQMTTLLLALSAVLFTTSTLLYSRHYRSIANNVATTSAITEAIREKRRTSLHLPAKEKMTNERRGEIQQFFEQRIKPQEKMGMKGKKQGLAKKAKPKPAPKLIDPIPSSLASNATFAACLLVCKVMCSVTSNLSWRPFRSFLTLINFSLDQGRQSNSPRVARLSLSCNRSASRNCCR